MHVELHHCRLTDKTPSKVVESTIFQKPMFLEYWISCIFHRSAAYYKGDHKNWQICVLEQKPGSAFMFLSQTYSPKIHPIILVKPIGEKTSEYSIVLFIFPVTNIGQEFHLLLRNIGYKLRSYILTKTNFSYLNPKHKVLLGPNLLRNKPHLIMNFFLQS